MFLLDFNTLFYLYLKGDRIFNGHTRRLRIFSDFLRMKYTVEKSYVSFIVVVPFKFNTSFSSCLILLTLLHREGVVGCIFIHLFVYLQE